MALTINQRIAPSLLGTPSIAETAHSSLNDLYWRFTDTQITMYRPDYYYERSRNNFAFDHDAESIALPAQYPHEPGYYHRSYRNTPYPRGSRSLTPQSTVIDHGKSATRKRIAVAVSPVSSQLGFCKT
jgi:hypothetical protein